MALIKWLGSLLGIGGGSIINSVGGVATNGALVLGAGWAYAHRDEVLHFHQDITVGTLVVLGLALFALVELLRRSNPGTP